MGWQWRLASPYSCCAILTTARTQTQSLIYPLEIKEVRVFHLILRNSLASLVSSFLTCFSRWLHQVMEQSKDCGTFPFSRPLAIFLPPLGLCCKQELVTLARSLIISQSQNWHWAPLSTPAGAAPLYLRPRRHLKTSFSSPKSSAPLFTFAAATTLSHKVLPSPTRRCGQFCIIMNVRT